MKKSITSFFRTYKQELLILSIAVLVLLLFVPIFTYLYFASDLETREGIMNRNNTGIVLLDRNGEPFFRFYEAHYTTFVPLDEIPPVVRQAVIVAEDKYFYQHPGFSIPAIVAAFVANLREGDLVYGGSTITQQLVKNSLLTPQKSFMRKYQELVLAQELERRYSKDEILEMYLNSVYFGEGAFGIDSAADVYFGTTAQELNVAQASMLAGLLTAPSFYSPLSGDEEKGKERQDYVLSQMLEEGYITEKEYESAKSFSLSYAEQDQTDTTVAPHFALMVRDELIRLYGEERIARSGFTIHTTLDKDWQIYAQETLEEHIASLASAGAGNGAVVVIDPENGEVRVLVGSKNWFDEEVGKVNMATTARQSGSSFKPIVYATGFEERTLTPATILHDRPTTFPGGYRPKNYDKRFRGNVTVRRALANSLNVPAVEALEKIGLSDALSMAKRLGISTLGEESDYGLSLVLGTGSVPLIELTNVYSSFANNGEQYPPTFITKIEDKHGEVVYTYKPEPNKVLDPTVTFLVSSILSDARARAETFGNALTIPRVAAVKTGTTEDYRDALTIGYTPQLVVGVWIGNNDNTPMNEVAGSLGAAPVWRDLMQQYLAGEPEMEFAIPEGITQATICRHNGYLLPNSAGSYGMTEYFIEGTVPTRICYPPRPEPEEENNAGGNTP